MKRHIVGIALLVFVVATTGCNTMGRQPRLNDAKITPATLKPGESAIITVKVVDKYKIISRVVAVVKEDQRIKFKLRDDGNPPDEKALDGVWTLRADVPFNAPPGQFTLEIGAYNSKNEPIQVKTGKGETGPLSATCIWSVEYPPEGQAPAAAAAPAEAKPKN
ncbi:MAG: hypothetical protein K1Y02_20535 [Candidatus Hydrogenedentes bacterium]|nr:hypothetical protein [Candidatus Hydrogenedentota bacterium]